MKNPFLIYGYTSPDLFCDRQTETQNLISAVTNGRNVTLMSPRRMGKTGLIHNAFYHLNKLHPEVKTFYMDVFSTNNLHEFTVLFGSTVLGALDSFSEKVINRISDFFRSCRPVVTVDSITGIPSVTLDIHASDASVTLKEIFAYLKDSGHECVIAIDEFQQITEYPEKGTEALLRSYIQFLPNVRFVFSGSKRHMMSDMFSSPKRPFYHSTQSMLISSINSEYYCDFAQRFFTKKGGCLPSEVFNYIYNKLSGHTWYVQRVLNGLYEACDKTVTQSDVDQVMVTILNQEEYNFQKQIKMLTNNQRNLLVAIAKEKRVKGVNRKDFVAKYHLGATSSINKALAVLIDKEFVIENQDYYEVYDRFMGIYLSR